MPHIRFATANSVSFVIPRNPLRRVCPGQSRLPDADKGAFLEDARGGCRTEPAVKAPSIGSSGFCGRGKWRRKLPGDQLVETRWTEVILFVARGERSKTKSLRLVGA